MTSIDHAVRDLHVVIFWFAGERTWGEGRTYQNVAEFLAGRPEVTRVTVTFPPLRQNSGYAWPFREWRISPKLSLLRETRGVVPSQGLGFRIRKHINRIVTNNAFRTVLWSRGYRANNTILWMFPPHPHIERVRDTVLSKFLIAHVVDNFAAHGDPWLNQYANVQYPLIRMEADLILVGSKFNLDRFGRPLGNVHLFENAVDEAFLCEPTLLPSRSGAIPRLGYVGTLNERTDLEILDYVATRHPEWQIVVAGKTEIPLEDIPFLRHQNVTHMGVIPYRELPAFLQTLDVCLIPHRNTEYSKSMSPLKLFQYLASGRPVVSTRIDGVTLFQDVIAIADSPPQFEELISKQLTHDTLETSLVRIRKAREETWQSRLDAMFAIVCGKWLEISAGKGDGGIKLGRASR